jgi:cytochrome b561
MPLRNTRAEYGLISKLLHWSIALPMIALIPLGWYMTGLSDEDVWYWRLLELHESLGLLVFALILVKLVWLRASPNPTLAPGLAAWERLAARCVHGFFIAAAVFIPVTGFLYVASDGEPIDLYRLIEIPAIGEYSKGVRDVLFDLHEYAAYTCAALIVVHILAALKHHFLDAKGSLRRIAF